MATAFSFIFTVAVYYSIALILMGSCPSPFLFVEQSSYSLQTKRISETLIEISVFL